MKDISIKRLGLIPLSKGAGLGAKRKLGILSELAAMGYRVRNPEMLDACSEEILFDYERITKTLAAVRGGDVEYVPLFTGFPNEVPADDAYFAKRIIGLLANRYRLFDEGEQLDNGLRIPRWLFDLRDFGADPVSQFQDAELYSKGKREQKRRKADSAVTWIDIRFVWMSELEDRLGEWLTQCLYAKSSIKAELHEDLQKVLAFLGADAVDAERIVQRENRALYAKLLWESESYEALESVLGTATDVLRLFAALEEGDLSLASTIRFPRMTRKQRRVVLQLLENCSNLEEDLYRYRGLWLAVAKGLHVGEYKTRFPRCFEAFFALRNGEIVSFEARYQKLLAEESLAQLLRHLSQRAGVFGRKLHELLRRFSQDHKRILSAFARAAESLSVKQLLVMKSYFASINEAECRTVINRLGRIKVLDNNAFAELDGALLSELDDLLETAIISQLAQREEWDGKTVWIDPRLEDYTVPLAQRAASDGLWTMGRGTRVAVDTSSVLRLFVYWKERGVRTDLDLSVIQYDAEFNYLGHVSYTNLKDKGIVHSGDLQSAPHGAAEFVDLNLACIPKHVRYLAVQVHRYAGAAFADLECHAGWMERQEVDGRYKSFDIKTVVNKFDLQGRSGYALPLCVDLQAGEIIWTDLYVGSKTMHNNVENSQSSVGAILRELAGFTESRPTIATLAKLHSKARGGILVQASEEARAQIRFGFEGATYDIRNAEQLLSELL